MAKRKNDSEKWDMYEPIFTFNKQTDDKLYYKCNLCQSVCSAATTSRSNLKRHLSNQHDSTHVKEFEAIVSGCTAKKKKGQDQSTLDAFLGKSKQSVPSQEKVDQLIAEFIPSCGMPFTIVRRQGFRKFVMGLAPGRTVLSYATLMSKLNADFNTMKTNMKKEFSNISVFCLTADCWTTFRRGYLGVTIHWLTSNLERKSAVLACRRMKGNHTYDRFAEELEAIMRDFGIQNKMEGGVVTDNASNFVKSFKHFGEEAHAALAELLKEASNKGEEDDDADENDNDEDGVIYQELTDILSSSDTLRFSLPAHFRCSAHTMNLIATKDVEKYLTTAEQFKRVSRKTMLKLHDLWNKQSKSTIIAQRIEDTCGKKLVVPICTRWNSTFHAMERVQEILNEKDDKMQSLFDHLGHRHLQNDEKIFIQEYVTTMQYFACALDILQGDKHMFLGYLLPTIHVLKEKLLEVKNTLTVCKPLVDGLVAGLDKRFGHLLSDEKYLLASVCHPKFKRLDFIHEENRRAAAYKLLQDAVEKEMPPDEKRVDIEEKSKDKIASFFSSKKVRSSSKELIERFLHSDTEELALLNVFPAIKRVFVQSNTTLPSSAPVERLFSHAGELFSRKRCRLSDKNFEQQLLLQLNKCFI